MEGSRAASLIRRTNLHQQVKDRLREMIVSGELVPGAHIAEKKLCEAFGVSRTPMREAIHALAAEGVITLVPGRGAAVASVSRTEIDEAFAVIGALEMLAGEAACVHILDGEIARARRHHDDMMECWRRGDLADYYRHNRRIHEIIHEAAGNELLCTLMRTLETRIMNLRFKAHLDGIGWQTSIREHEQIIAALEARDGPALGRILRTHLSSRRDAVTKWLTTTRKN